MSPTFQSLAALSRAIVACNRCPRLRTHCRTVAADKTARYRDQAYWGKPVPGFGDARARLLVVGLAPGAHGANRTGRLFTGDSSGDWLYEALHRFGFANQAESVSRSDGLVLSDCFISAAGRCAPPGNKPTSDELTACRDYLEAETRLLRHVRVVVTLGGIAHARWLKASGWWERLGPGGRPGFGPGVASRLPSGIVVVSSYHPSRQNTHTGRLTRPMWHAVFRAARRLVVATP